MCEEVFIERRVDLLYPRIQSVIDYYYLYHLINTQREQRPRWFGATFWF